MTHIVTQMLEFIISMQFIILWCVGILLIAGYAFVRYFRQFKKISDDITKAQSEIEIYEVKSESDLEGIGQRMLAVESIKSPWMEFSKHLYEDKKCIKSSGAPEGIFNEESLVSSRVNEQTLDSIPNNLTAMGIIGTFLGLSAGVYLAKDGLSNNEMAQLQLALTQLLGGASLAFITSIFGIVSSLVFTKFKNDFYHRMGLKIHSLNLIIRDKFNVVSFENILSFQLAKQEEHTELLKEMVSEMKSMRKHKDQMNEKILSNLVLEFRDVLTSGASKQLSLLSKDFEKASDTLRQCAQDMKENTKVIVESGETSLKLIEEGLKNAAHSFAQELSKAVSSISHAAKLASADVGAGILEAGLHAVEELKSPAGELSESVRMLCESSRQATEDWADALLCTEKIADHLLHTQEELKKLQGLPAIYPKSSSSMALK